MNPAILLAALALLVSVTALVYAMQSSGARALRAEQLNARRLERLERQILNEKVDTVLRLATSATEGTIGRISRGEERAKARK